MRGEAAAPGVVARRTGFHAVLDLLPSLSRGELLNVAFRVAGLTGPLIEAPQELLLQTKARMQQVLRDQPLDKWGEALAPSWPRPGGRGSMATAAQWHRACACSSIFHRTALRRPGTRGSTPRCASRVCAKSASGSRTPAPSAGPRGRRRTENASSTSTLP